RDIGRAAGSAAHLVALRRTHSGSVGLGDCLPLDAVDAAHSPEEVLAHALDPVAALSAPVRRLGAQEAADAACGKAIPVGTVVCADGTERAPKLGERVAMVFDQRLVGVWSCGRRGLVCAVNFPAGITGVRA
ncbi:MAG: tRNA pseudouridine(55) synthase TruB, partial [Olsenella sp.]|nr:tRNA pseudouridine(55) synthase TruB [Olsenella sp.]